MEMDAIPTSSNEYCLKWNSHQSNLSLAIGNFFLSENLADVVLVCDNKFIKCHKMVLAACSSYFNDLFLTPQMRMQNQSPIIVLKDVHYPEIKAILEFMYKGKVIVSLDQVGNLLKAARSLKVKGLVETEEGGQQEAPQQFQGQQEFAHPRSAFTPTPIYSPFTDNNYLCHLLANGIPIDNSALYHGFPHPYWNWLPEAQVPMIPQPFLPYSVPSTMPSTETATNLLSPRSDASSVSVATESQNQCCDQIPLEGKDTIVGVAKADSPIPVHKKCFQRMSMPISDYSTMLKKKETPSSSYSFSGKTDCPAAQGTSQGESQTQSYETTPALPKKRQRLSGNCSKYSGKIRNRKRVGNGKVDDDNHSFLDKSQNKKDEKVTDVLPTSTMALKCAKKYSDGDILAAIEEVQSGKTVFKTSRKFKIPHATLYKKMKKLGDTVVNRTVLFQSESPSFERMKSALENNSEDLSGGGRGSNVTEIRHLVGKRPIGKDSDDKYKMGLNLSTANQNSNPDTSEVPLDLTSGDERNPSGDSSF